MKKCPHCGAMIADDNARFCLECGHEVPKSEQKVEKKSQSSEKDTASLIGDKNLINESTIIGKQEKYEASNITIHNNITEDHSHTTVVCAVSGKRIYMDQSIECPVCGKPVAQEYYVERAKRCENCDKAAREEFRQRAAQLLGRGVLDAALKTQLDGEAKRLRIDAESEKEILRSLQQGAATKPATLSSVQQAELEAAIKSLTEAENPDDARRALRAFKALEEVSANYGVLCWYHLAWATVDPQGYIKQYEEELTDNYWQRYWGYLAYTITGTAKGGAAIERLRSAFPDHEADVLLAEAAYLLGRGFAEMNHSLITSACSHLPQIRREYLSQPLMPIYEAMERLMREGGIRLGANYSKMEVFVLIDLLRAGGYVKQLQAQQEAEAEAKRQEELRQQEEARRREIARQEEEARRREAARQEQLRQERERAAREEARRQKQADLAADRSKRLNEEMSRLDGKPATKPADEKAFVGYQTTIPPKKGGWKRTLLIIFIVLVVILIALFLIPAPESMQ